MNDEPNEPPAIDFSSLPTVDPTEPDAGARRSPRFDGDVSELPDRACWALQHLVTRRYISKNADPDVWAWVTHYRRKLAVRLSELDLRLRISDGLDVGYVEQMDYESSRGRKVLRRETLGTYDSILGLHLAKMMRSATDEHVLISREDIHGLFSGVVNPTDTNRVTFDGRIDGAIGRLEQLGILIKSKDDEDSFTVSPVISAIMTASVVTELQHQFELLIRTTNGRADEGVGDDDE